MSLFIQSFSFIYLVEFILETPDLRHEFSLKLICSCVYVVGGQNQRAIFILKNFEFVKNRFYLDIKTPPRKTFEK